MHPRRSAVTPRVTSIGLRGLDFLCPFFSLHLATQRFFLRVTVTVMSTRKKADSMRYTSVRGPVDIQQNGLESVTLIMHYFKSKNDPFKKGRKALQNQQEGASILVFKF